MTCALAAPAPAGPPRIAAYTVVNGAAIEAPLAGLSGDAVRGAALFADPDAGACASCHSFAGRLATGAPAGVILAATPPAPEVGAPEPEPEPEPEAAASPRGAEGSSLAPIQSPAPLPRGVDAVVPPDDEDAPAPEEDAAPDLVLVRGPALDDAAARLGAGGVRLWIVDPGLAQLQAAPGADGPWPMPAYHAVDFNAALRAPDLRQPWLSAQEIEDLVAYLMKPPAPR
jgi:hypothetical protein